MTSPARRVSLTILIAATWPALAGEPEEYLRLLQGAYERKFDYRASWREATPYGGPRSDLDRLLAVSEDIVPFTDAPTGMELWTLREGTTSYDAADNALAVAWWAMHLRDQRQLARTVSIFQPNRYALIPIGDDPARLLEGSGETAADVLRARKKGELTAGDLVCTADFIAFVRRAADILPGAPDLRVINETDETATIGSEALGITCTIRRDSGECVAATFSKPGKAPSRWEVLDWLPESRFPARHPSLVRREWSSGQGQMVRVVIFDEFLTNEDSSHDVAWSTYRDSAWDRMNNRIIAPDGTILEENAAPPGAVSLRPMSDRTRWRMTHQRRTPQSPPLSESDALPPPAPAAPNTTRVALLITGGSILALSAGLVVSRRWRA